MANIIDAILRLTDNFTPTLTKASDGLTQYSKQALRVGKDLQKIGDNVSKVGKTLTASITTPIVGAGVASLKFGMDFEQSMSRVKALSQSTDTEFEQLNDLAIQLGADTALSASEVSEAMQYMALAGWDANDMIQGTAGVISLATASGEDLAEVCDIVTDAISAFGLEADSSSRFADVFASTVTNSNTTVHMMGEAFTYVSSVAGAFNYSLEDTALAIGLMANSSIKASQGGTALRKMMTELNGEIEVVGKNLGEWTFNTVNADGTMKPFRETLVSLRKAFSQLSESEKVANAEALVGKTGMAGFLALINASEDSFNDLAYSIDNSKGSAEEMSKVMLDNLAGIIESISGSIESFAIIIYRTLSPKLKQFATVVDEVAEKFSSLNTEQMEGLLKTAGIIASIPPLIMVYGKLIKFVGSAMVAYGKFGKSVKSAGSIMKVIFSPANKIVLIMTAIALVAYLVIKHWDKIKPVLDSVYTFMKDIWSAMGIDLEGVKQAFTTAKQHIITAISVIRQWISDHSEQISAVLNFLKDLFIVIFSGIVGYLSGWVGNVIKIVNHVIDAFNALCDFIGHAMRGEWEKAWKSLFDVVKNILGAIVDYVLGKIEAISGAVKGVVKAIKNLGKEKVEVQAEAETSISPIIKNTDSVPTLPTSNFLPPRHTLTTKFPAFAKGTNYFTGGLAQINEKGGEIVDLPTGTRIIPHDKSLQVAKQQGIRQGSSNGININVQNLTVREDADIDKIANALYSKFKKHALNMA